MSSQYIVSFYWIASEAQDSGCFVSCILSDTDSRLVFLGGVRSLVYATPVLPIAEYNTSEHLYGVSDENSGFERRWV